MNSERDPTLLRRDCFLGLGSNLGNRERNLTDALRLLDGEETRVVECSSLYETEPVDVTNQPDFLNLVCRLETELKALELLSKCQRVEKQLGRIRYAKRGPRVIDIDILYFGSEIIESEHLTVPHPKTSERGFVLVPLAEIAPDFLDPRKKERIRELLEQCPDSSRVVYFVAPPL